MWHTPHTYVCNHGLLDPITVELDDAAGKRILDLHSPCKTDETIYCYVNRYREKTIILIYMVVFTLFSISLTIAELILFSVKYGFNTHKPPNERRGLAKRHMDKKMKRDKAYFQSRHPEYAVLNSDQGGTLSKEARPIQIVPKDSKPKETGSPNGKKLAKPVYPVIDLEVEQDQRDLKRLKSAENSLHSNLTSNSKSYTITNNSTTSD